MSNNKEKPFTYGEYLHLETLLSCQHPKSDEVQRPAHDEMFFIIVHQTYELWFKQIIFELKTVIDMFNLDRVDEKDVSLALDRISRVNQIQRILVDQLTVLETMTPLDFLDFRDYLLEASGFQSKQFRQIEQMLGKKRKPESKFYGKPSLFTVVEKWLERTPFIEHENFKFLEEYKANVAAQIDAEIAFVNSRPNFNEEEKRKHREGRLGAKETFEAIFDRPKYEELLEKGQRRLSFKAAHGALLILLYRDQPLLNLPYRFVTALLELDDLIATWRYRHVLTVRRMLGNKIGSAGSLGFDYLWANIERSRIFTDFADMSNFLIKREGLPQLPDNILEQLGFCYTCTPS